MMTISRIPVGGLMADLTKHAYWHCMSAVDWRRTVTGTNGKTYTVVYGIQLRGPFQYGYSCDCKSFKFKKTCKHITYVSAERCNWMQVNDGGDLKDGHCPKCGGECGCMLHAS